jgi:hypothetical protein
MLVAPSDDPLRQGGADAREACDLAHVGTIQINALPRQQWPRQLRGAARGFS